MQFVFFYPKDIQNVFWKTIDFVENLEMTQIAGGGGLMFFVSLRHNAYKNRYEIHRFTETLSMSELRGLQS